MPAKSTGQAVVEVVVDVRAPVIMYEYEELTHKAFGDHVIHKFTPRAETCPNFDKVARNGLGAYLIDGLVDNSRRHSETR